MDSLLLSISPSDPLWLAVAFIFGLAARLIGLPPLIGFLLAGFSLNAAGAKSGEFLNAVADLGITLLLFYIGLKLRLKSLAKREVWGVATVHMALTTSLFSLLVFLFAVIGLPLFTELNVKQALLIGFSLSFSSTVFAVKVLDELGAVGSKQGQVSIGVLVIQDIVAVLFLAVSLGKAPSIWAITLLALIPLKYILHKILDKTGHGELLVMFGICVALVGADIFELVGIKGDAGALILGMLFATHPKANELAKTLVSFKELFLVGFFLSVGMAALPSWEELMVAILFVAILPIKVALYFGLFSAFSLRASTSWRSSLNLANYSEFGLIVGALAVAYGWLTSEWLAVFAIALSLSFILSAPLISVRDKFYERAKHRFRMFEKQQRLEDEKDFNLAGTRVVIFGMGRMGSAAYMEMANEYAPAILGVDINELKVAQHVQEGRHVVAGDATNPDFWTKAKGLLNDLESVLLTMESHSANVAAAVQLKRLGYKGFIAATSKFEDEEKALKEMGVDFTFNIYAEAGLGFANDLKARRN